MTGGKQFCRVGFSPPALDKGLGGLKPTLRLHPTRNGYRALFNTPAGKYRQHPYQGLCMHSVNLRRGYLLGICAYAIWGLFPLYFKLLAQVPSAEIVVHRVLWSALCGSLLLLVWKHPGWWRELRAHPQRLLVLTASGQIG